MYHHGTRIYALIQCWHKACHDHGDPRSAERPDIQSWSVSSLARRRTTASVITGHDWLRAVAVGRSETAKVVGFRATFAGGFVPAEGVRNRVAT
jgi:hypothetical protein